MSSSNTRQTMKLSNTGVGIRIPYGVVGISLPNTSVTISLSNTGVGIRIPYSPLPISLANPLQVLRALMEDGDYQGEWGRTGFPGEFPIQIR